ncbi:MAG: 2Fe-2S iron-sulfur cluster binding domain-containing protein [Bdellovibrionales bacterium]|nr:2Fe-2S iron-sulfur cluster binding domain-containing protein [Bdellovibrionales bacterium]
MATVVIHQASGTQKFECDDTMTIYDAAEKAGLDLPASCVSGSCGACEAQLISGKVDMEYYSALTDEEVEEGKILTCQSLCKSDVVEIRYDD